MNHNKKLVLSALFLAIGLVLPFFTGQIPRIGNMLLPMHIPVLLCGFLCGWKYGLLIGFLTPLLRSILFGMPPLPQAFAMSFELATYGAITGLLYSRLRSSKAGVYLSLITAMLSGRLIWAAASMIIYGINGSVFTWQIFIGGAFLNAIPGILLQLLFIPPLILFLNRVGGKIK